MQTVTWFLVLTEDASLLVTSADPYMLVEIIRLDVKMDHANQL